MQGNTTTHAQNTITLLVVVMLLLSMGTAVIGRAHEPPVICPGTPHVVAGHVYWPDGSLDVTVPLPVSVTNNRTGEKAVVFVDVAPGGNEDGTYRVDLSNSVFYPSGYLATDIICVNSTYTNMWSCNATTAAGTFSICDLHMVGFPFGPEYITQASGGSITGYNGAVTLDVPAGALPGDTFIYGVDGLDAMGGSFDSITLGPSGLVFSSPATLTWSYAGLDIGSVPEGSLAIYTSNGGPWEKLPCFVDLQAKNIVAQVSHFSNFSLGGAAVFGNQTYLTMTYPGATNAPILDLTIINTDIAIDDTLDYINVISNSTDNSDIAGISLWNDLDNDQNVDAGDAQIGITQPVAGANFTGLAFNIPADSVLNMLVAIDVSGTATAGNFLDLYLPIAGIGLANAGLLDEAIDPAGNVLVAVNPVEPHAIYGTVRNVLGLIPSICVNVTNNRTGAVNFTMTDSDGRYEVDLGWMPGGYLDNDTIFVQANDSYLQSAWNTTVVNASYWGERCDIFLGKGPIASDEIPANGSTVFDVQQNITVNITSAPLLLNLTTIILEVEGVNYTMANANLSFLGNTLTFNTSGAVGVWADGQVVNVTLWQANDTAGNLCQNAPYVWWFQVLVTMNPAAGLWIEKASANGSVAGDITLHWRDTNSGSLGYDVFASNNRADFNFSSPTHTTAPGETNWTHVGANNDGLNWFYIVRPVGGTNNSTMGYKIVNQIGYNNPAIRTNGFWFGIPINTTYYNLLTAVVRDIEGGTGVGTNHILTTIGYWNGGGQGIVTMTYTGFGWTTASDAPLQPGMAVYMARSNRWPSSWNWVINGTDFDNTVTIGYNNPVVRTNGYWFSVPISGGYDKLTDIVIDIEGGTGPGMNHNITTVGYWNGGGQGIVTMTYTGFGWTVASDAPLLPGMAVYIARSNVWPNPYDWSVDITVTEVP